MSAFTGRQQKGAMRKHREIKRAEAEQRDAALGQHDPRRKVVRKQIERLGEAS